MIQNLVMENQAFFKYFKSFFGVFHFSFVHYHAFKVGIVECTFRMSRIILLLPARVVQLILEW